MSEILLEKTLIKYQEVYGQLSEREKLVFKNSWLIHQKLVSIKLKILTNEVDHLHNTLLKLSKNDKTNLTQFFKTNDFKSFDLYKEKGR